MISASDFHGNYSVQYSNTIIPGAIKKGNFYINDGSIVGPTSQTGFYNSIPVPVAGFTLYEKKIIQGPSIRVFQTEQDLIDFTNKFVSPVSNIYDAIDLYENDDDYLLIGYSAFNEFVAEFTTTTPSKTIMFALSNFATTIDKIDYGDGVVGIVGTSNSHTYSTAGTYTVKVYPKSGKYVTWYWKNTWDKDKIGVVRNIGRSLLRERSFNGCTNLDLSGAKGVFVLNSNISQAFRDLGVSYNNKIKGIDNADWSGVTNGSAMFYNLQSYNHPLLFSNLSSLTNGESMFDNLKTYNHPLLFNNLSSLTGGKFMFSLMLAYNHPLLFSNLSSLTNGYCMLSDLQSYNHPLLFSNLSSLIDGSYMFRRLYAYAYNHIYVTSNLLTSIFYMFYGNLLTPTIILTDCSGVTDANYTFLNCTSLTTIFLGGLSISFSLQWSTSITKQALIDLCDGGMYNGTAYNGIADMTGLASPTATLPAHITGTDRTDVNTAFNAKNWTTSWI